jgi:hypothetical protein
VLFSHGLAKPTEALFNRLQGLHPPLKEPIPDLTTQVDPFTLPARQVCKVLFKQCSEQWNSPDPYGWNTALLHLVRSARRPSFFSLFCGLVSHVLDASVSDLVAFALSGGSIFGLNKDHEDEQAERLQKGLDPRERPINQGSLILKLAFDLALHSPEAQHAAEALQPIQQGVGAQRGMEMIAHVCNALYSEGFAILKVDATNGFQEIKRASLHRAVARRCPSLLPLFKKYYTKESVCFFNLEGDVRLLKANEGARIGCKLSSFVFGLAVQDLYERLKCHVARTKDGSCVKAATDDVVVAIKADRMNEAALYEKVDEICAVLEKDAKELGLSFTNDKKQLLLPRDWAPSSGASLPRGVLIRSNTFDDPKLRGMEIVGAPIGSKDFCHAFVAKTLDTMLRESESLLKLHPQSATKLLRDCVCAAPCYIAQVCHPNLTKELLIKFDDSIWKLWLHILGGTGGSELGCCETVLTRARLKAFLPSRLDGVGLRSWERTADFAWFASVASCIALSDPDFEFARKFLTRPAADAYEFAFEALGGPSYLVDGQVEIIPVGEPEVLCTSTSTWIFSKRIQNSNFNMLSST